MALGEEKAELEPYANTKVQGPEPEQLPCPEAEGGPTFVVCRTKELACWAEAELSGTSGIYASQASVAHRAAEADGPVPVLCDLFPPAITGTGDLSAGSQMEEMRLPGIPQTINTPRTAAPCLGHDANTEGDSSPADSPQVLGLSRQPHTLGVPFPSQRKSMVSPGTTVPRLCNSGVSASSTDSSLQVYQEKAEPQSCSLAKAATSLEQAVPKQLPTAGAAAPRLQWSSQPVAPGSDTTDLGRRRLSFQAEYWACVLPDSLPPSPDRHSPLWNPNKEYEDLLDYTYPLRAGPRLLKQLDSHTVADPVVLQDSGIDLDSFSVSPTSTLKSPVNVFPGCPLAEASTSPFCGPKEPNLKNWPSGALQKQGVPRSQLASTPKANDHGAAAREGRETSLRGTKNWLPVGKQLKLDFSQIRTRDREWSLPRPEGEVRARESVLRPAPMESEWKSEEMDSDEEYLALPARLTQVSSLLSYLGNMPTLVTLPTGAAEGQSSLEVSDSNGPASLPSDSSQSQLPSGAAFPRSRAPEGQNPHNFMCARNCAEDSLLSSQALGVCGVLKSHPSLPTMLNKWPFSDPGDKAHPPRIAEEQRKDSLVQCVQTFCCQLEQLIHWLYNVTDVTDLGTPHRSSLTGLKSSLQFYRQFKKDIHEHQSLTESVLEKGETLLQCLLDNTPVLKDVLGRISKQSGELESHADRLYDSILASLDMLAGCSLIPDSKPVTTMEAPCGGV